MGYLRWGLGQAWLAAMVIIITFVPLPDAASAAPNPRDCAPYVFLGARGSGEPSPLNTAGRPDVGRYGVGGLGHTLTPEYAKLIELLNDPLGVVAEARYVPYEAFDALHWGKAELVGLLLRGNILVAGAGDVASRRSHYYSSVSRGINRLVDELKNLNRFCPRSTKIILAGYSQGAHVVGHALGRVGKGLRKRILAVSLFGDPLFNPLASGAGDFLSSRSGLLGSRSRFPRDIRDRVKSWCYAGDWICQGVDDPRNISAASATHRSYGSSAANLEALRVFQLIRKHEAAKGASTPTAPRPAARPVDVSFVVDSTGSMFAAIDSVKEDLQLIRDRLAASATSLRTAFVDYKDEPSEDSVYQNRLVSPLTDDAVAFERAVDGLEADGGGDYEESVFGGVNAGLSLAWRPDAAKFVLLIGDAPPKDPEPISGLTEATIVDRALRVSAPIYGLTVEDDETTRGAFSRLSAATLGRSYDIDDPTAVASSIVEAIEFQARVPTASIGGSSPGASVSLSHPRDGGIGEPIRFSTAASVSPVGEALLFIWNFGDGSVLSTRQGVVAHTWKAPFEGNVTVTVIDESGRSAHAIRPVRIVGKAQWRPGKLRRPRVRIGRRGPWLRWRPPVRGLPSRYEVRANGRLVGSVKAPAKRRASISLRVRGLRKPRKVKFTVRAIDRHGRAVTSKPARAKRVGARHRKHR